MNFNNRDNTIVSYIFSLAESINWIERVINKIYIIAH